MIADVLTIAAVQITLGASIMGMGGYIFYKWNKEND